MKIYLSPSMQIHNAYATGNTTECEQCNRIAEYAEIALKRCGFEVKKAKKGQDMLSNIKESNDWNADLHIPIHTNAGSSGNGTLVMVYSNAEQNMKPAKIIYDKIQAITPGTIEYGIKVRKDLAELNSTKAIAIYIEVEFHDKVELAQWIIDNVSLIGETLCKAICDYANVPYNIEETSQDIYRVQVGAFKSKDNAQVLANELISKGYNAIIK